MTRHVDVESPAPLVVSTEEDPSAEWDAFVADAGGGSFCHLAAWRGVMQDVLGHEALYAVARGPDGALHGILPLVRVRSRLFGHFLVSMPFLNYGGALGSPEARFRLADWARGLAEREHADLLELRWREAAFGAPEGPSQDAPSHAPDGARPSGLPEELTVTHRKVTVVLPLPDDPQLLWENGLKAKVRSQVRRPMKEGFDARHGPDEVHAFYDVLARNMRDLGTPVLPKRLFESLPEAFGDATHFTTVYAGDTPVAAGCGFFFGREFEITWASSLREFNRAAPNMLLYWRMMEHAIGRGARAFNFGRCTPGGGTHRFKLQWGGADEPLPWGAWSPSGTLATPNPEQGRFRLATSVWSRLPVPFTRVMGPPLARRIP